MSDIAIQTFWLLSFGPCSVILSEILSVSVSRSRINIVPFWFPLLFSNLLVVRFLMFLSISRLHISIAMIDFLLSRLQDDTAELLSHVAGGEKIAQLVQKWLGTFKTSSVWSRVVSGLEAWQKELGLLSFQSTAHEVSTLRVCMHSAWKPLCAAVREDPSQVAGFPIAAAILPNVNNKPALQAMNELFKHTGSVTFSAGYQQAISKAVMLKNGFAMVWELQHRLDILHGLLAICVPPHSCGYLGRRCARCGNLGDRQLGRGSCEDDASHAERRNLRDNRRAAGWGPE